LSPVVFVAIACCVLALWLGSVDEGAHGHRAKRVADSNARSVREAALLQLLDMTEGTSDLSLRVMRQQWEGELLSLTQDGD
jgi:hypothetical protein